MSRSLKILIVGSVLLNMFLGGLFVGRWIRAPLFDRQTAQDLPAEVKTELTALRRESGQIHREKQKLRTEMSRLLKAETFDAGAFAEVLNSYENLRGRMTRVRLNRLLRVAKKLSPEKRRKLAEKMEKKATRGQRRSPRPGRSTSPKRHQKPPPEKYRPHLPAHPAPPPRPQKWHGPDHL